MLPYFSANFATVLLLLICSPAAAVVGSLNAAAVATYMLMLLLKLYCCCFYPVAAVVEALLLLFLPWCCCCWNSAAALLFCRCCSYSAAAFVAIQQQIVQLSCHCYNQLPNHYQSTDDCLPISKTNVSHYEKEFQPYRNVLFPKIVSPLCHSFRNKGRQSVRIGYASLKRHKADDQSTLSFNSHALALLLVTLTHYTGNLALMQWPGLHVTSLNRSLSPLYPERSTFISPPPSSFTELRTSLLKRGGGGMNNGLWGGCVLVRVCVLTD